MDSPEQLLTQVITEKVNMFDFTYYFEKYKLDDNGWTVDSLMKVSEDEMLEFHERQIKEVFRSIDTNSSKTISEKELREKLTGMKEFS